MYGKSVSTRDTWHGYLGSSLQNTYDVEAVLGTGGCGAVYKAWHKRLRKHIVLKVLRNSSRKTETVRRNEVEALKNIKNMHIPQVFDYLTEEDSSFTVMEYIEGESMDKLLGEGRVFSRTQIIKWYRQLAAALDVLHQKGVCHRDIKPGNIMLMPADDVCLIDFNSALVNGNNTKVISRSLGYASPEQYEYFQECDDAARQYGIRQTADTDDKLEKDTRVRYPHRRFRHYDIDWKLSDIYSLGATMYHLRTGRRPPLQTCGADPISAVGEYTTGIDGIIEQSMRILPSMRFPSARELCAALQELYEPAIKQ